MQDEVTILATQIKRLNSALATITPGGNTAKAIIGVQDRLRDVMRMVGATDDEIRRTA
jgi:hypothetical protein